MADYHGQPHLYESRWDDSKDFGEGVQSNRSYLYYYWLSPVTPDVLALALEDWAIWKRWRAAFDERKADISTHPALPHDRARHDQLKSLLGQALQPGQPGAFLVAGKFKGKLEALSVRWTQPQS